MKLPGFLRAHPDGVSISIKLQPRAARNEIVDSSETELKIRVTAPPVDSAANEALLRFLAETLQCPRHAVRLQRGGTSRHKQLWIQGVTVERVLAALTPRAR
jgi:uncharacterized protein (TIGR00251 family)